MVEYLDKEWLYQQYIVEDKSSTEIAEMCYVKPSKIKNYLQKYNIYKRGNVRYHGDEGGIRYLYSKYKSRAKDKALTFTLTIEAFTTLIMKDCIYCGIQPQNECKKRYHHLNDIEYNGIDRIDNSKGYVDDNCVPCCEQCNKAKRNLDIGKFFQWIEKVYNKLYPVVMQKRG